MFVHNLKTIFQNLNRIKTSDFLHKSQRLFSTKPATAFTSETEKFEVGSVHHGFKVQSVQDVNEFAMKAIYLEHENTKAKYLHLARNDSNNVFSVNFRTTPMDSTGLPHILEHTVLCGSKSYPVKDPFFKMLNRSLATFMNAMTAPDFTFYPFSTMNETDFKNLQSVYLDATFEPMLTEFDFMQEGWRLEYENLEDPKSNIIIKGVVYNEMKGVFGDNDMILARQILNQVMPDHTYGVESGGDPLEIPKLTWEDLKNFHKKYYRPSNCKLYSYGNFSISPTLKYLDKKFSQVGRKEPIDSRVIPQKRWDQPKYVNIHGKVDTLSGDVDKQNCISISLVMSDINDIYDTFVLQFLTILLIQGPTSPFYKSLIELGISGGYTSSSGFDNQTRDTVFTIGLQKIDKKDFDTVVDIFNKTIDEVIQSGFSQRQIDSILHSYELSLKHESDNFGLKLLYGLAAIMNHDGDVNKALQANELIGKLKTNMAADKNYLTNQVKKYFKENNHRLILTMTVDPDYETKMADAEKQLLEEKVKCLSEEDKKAIFEKGLLLRNEQSKQEDVSLLPTLKLNDISKNIEKTPLEFFSHKQVPIQVCETTTNGITYLKMLLNTNHLVETEYFKLLPLFSYVVNKLGTDKRTYEDFDLWTTEKTNGLSINASIVESLTDINQYETRLMLSSFCLDKNLPEMLQIWQELFQNRKLDNVKRFENLLQMYVAELTNGLLYSGHIYAAQIARSLVTPSSLHKENLFGLEHIKFMQNLIKTHSTEEILNKMAAISNLVFNKNKLRVALNTLPQNKQNSLNRVQNFIDNLNSSGSSVNKPSFISTLNQFKSAGKTQCKHALINSPVYYCAKAIKATPYCNKDYSNIQVLSNLVSFKYLHSVVREKNGAYGSGMKLNTDGVISFYSYRDPNSTLTLDTFDGSLEFIQENMDKLTEQNIFEAKLGVFKDLDRPVIPANRGAGFFLLGINDEMLQERRLNTLNVTKRDLVNVAERYLNGELVKDCTGKAVIGPKIENFEECAKKKDEEWIVDENQIS